MTEFQTQTNEFLDKELKEILILSAKKGCVLFQVDLKDLDFINDNNIESFSNSLREWCKNQKIKLREENTLFQLDWRKNEQTN